MKMFKLKKKKKTKDNKLEITYETMPAYFNFKHGDKTYYLPSSYIFEYLDPDELRDLFIKVESRRATETLLALNEIEQLKPIKK